MCWHEVNVIPFILHWYKYIYIRNCFVFSLNWIRLQSKSWKRQKSVSISLSLYRNRSQIAPIDRKSDQFHCFPWNVLLLYTYSNAHTFKILIKIKYISYHLNQFCSLRQLFLQFSLLNTEQTRIDCWMKRFSKEKCLLFRERI